MSLPLLSVSLQKDAPWLPPKTLKSTMRQIRVPPSLRSGRQRRWPQFTSFGNHFALRDEWVHNESQSHHPTPWAWSCSSDEVGQWLADWFMARLVNSHQLPLVGIDQVAEIPPRSTARSLPANTLSPNGTDDICLHIETFWTLSSWTIAFLTTKPSSPLLTFHTCILSSWGSKSIHWADLSLVFAAFLSEARVHRAHRLWFTVNPSTQSTGL